MCCAPWRWRCMIETTCAPAGRVHTTPLWAQRRARSPRRGCCLCQATPTLLTPFGRLRPLLPSQALPLPLPAASPGCASRSLQTSGMPQRRSGPGNRSPPLGDSPPLTGRTTWRWSAALAAAWPASAAWASAQRAPWCRGTAAWRLSPASSPTARSCVDGGLRCWLHSRQVARWSAHWRSGRQCCRALPWRIPCARLRCTSLRKK